MLASFSIVPIGVGKELARKVAEVISLIADSGLDYKVGAMHTTIEGEPEAVLALIMKCHNRMKELAPRVLTTITIDDRKGAKGRLTGKVKAVEKILRRKLEHE